MVKIVLLFGLSACAYAEPLLLTGGSWNLEGHGHWTFIGDGFSAFGDDDFTGVNHCGFCLAPFQLPNPLPVSVPANSGLLTLGEKSYILPDAGFLFNRPWA